MNKRTVKIILTISIIVAAMISVITSCDLLGTSIESRVSKFVSDLNKPSGTRYLAENNFHSDISGSYTGELLFGGTSLRATANSNNYSINLSGITSSTHNGETLETGTFYSATDFPGGTGITFHFKEDGANNWKIYYISIPLGAGGPWGS